MEPTRDEIIGYVGLSLIGIPVAYFVPGFLAQVTGWEQAHDQLVTWAKTREMWLFIPLVFVYVLSGFFSLVVTISAGVVTAYMLFLGIKAATIWLAETTYTLATAFFNLLVKSITLVFQILIWPFQVVADFVQHFAVSSTAYIRQRWAERLEIRRLYREEFSDQFRSFREFKRNLNDSGTKEKQDKRERQEPPKVDPYAASLRLLGLTGNFTARELEDRYRKLMRGVHPDVAGPNELAAKINQARDLIKRRKGWK